MKIGVLTSSRADYGIYKSLLEDLSLDDNIELEIIAFGMHLMPQYGDTIQEIQKDGFGKIHEVIGLQESDDIISIAVSYANVCKAFSQFYFNNTFDLVLALGDRFEMNAAVQAGIPFNVRFGHIHAGEKTLGAIDNIYRHQISLASKILFTSTEDYKEEGQKYLQDKTNAYNVGALSLDNVGDIKFDDEAFFKESFNIPAIPFVLITFHPETVRADSNLDFARNMHDALLSISKDIHLVVTMPNADTTASHFRSQLEKLKKEIPQDITLIENFGKRHYFNAMHYAQFMLGNTSSGIIEAASFGKYVINVGNRQEGRAHGTNVLNCNFDANTIAELAKNVHKKGKYNGENIYFQKNVSFQIKEKIKKYLEKL